MASPSSPKIARHVQSAVDACAAALEGLNTSAPSDQTYRVGQTVEIRINTRAEDAGALLCAVGIGEESSAEVAAEVCRAPDDAWLVRFAPPQADVYSLRVTWDGKEIDGSPFRLVFRGASEPERVQVRGLDDGKAWRVGRPVHFAVDTRQAGKGKLVVRASGPTQGLPKFDLHDNGDGTYRAAYVPSAVGEHCFEITYSDDLVPGEFVLVRVLMLKKSRLRVFVLLDFEMRKKNCRKTRVGGNSKPVSVRNALAYCVSVAMCH